jgi:hypothetical protein
MLITLDIKNESMKDNFLNFIGTLDYIDIKSDTEVSSNISKKHDENKFSQFAGMWQNKDISLDTIRQKAWQR